VKISILANHSSFFFLKTTVHFNLVFVINLTFSLKVSNDVCGFLHCTEYRFNYFYAYSSDRIVFQTDRNDRCGFLEIETCRPNSPENWQHPSFFVGIMPTIIFPEMEVEDGGG
jgi:hypothetical protein